MEALRQILGVTADATADDIEFAYWERMQRVGTRPILLAPAQVRKLLTQARNGLLEQLRPLPANPALDMLSAAAPGPAAEATYRLPVHEDALGGNADVTL